LYFVWFARPALIIQRRLFYGTSFIATCVHDSPQLCWGFGIVSIKRLVTKGALSYEKQSRVFVYTPLIEEKEYIGQESHSFLERYYDGDITAMLSAYIEDDRLSESEIDTLHSLLHKGAKRRD